MHKVFISYHHLNDQYYKEELLRQNDLYDIFIDRSVDTGAISDDLSDQRIREVIRDDYLRDSTVTILLVGSGTKGRKHIDWELYSSMVDGKVNKRSGILVIKLPSVSNGNCHASHDGESTIVHPDIVNWTNSIPRTEHELRHPTVPNRIIDNLLQSKSYISILDWEKIDNHPDKLKFLVEATHNDRTKCEYDLSRPMRRANA